MDYDKIYEDDRKKVVPEIKKEEQLLELPDDVTDVKELAKLATPGAIRTLYQIALSGVSEAARVAAANAILDRGHGKPTQAVDITGKLTLAQLVEQSFTLEKANVIDADAVEVSKDE